MAITFERTLSFKLDAGADVAITMQFDNSGEVHVHANVTEANGTQSNSNGVWKFNASNNSLQFSSHGSGVALCVIGCLGIAVGKSLLECLLNSSTIAEIESCLKEKAVGALADAVTCIAHCLGIP
jgi:hypothetical protein